MFKYLLAQPANVKFKWELDVVLTNIRSLDKTTPIVLLFLEEKFGIPGYFEEKYENVEAHTYSDQRQDRSYIPSIRPYLFWRYLSENPEAEKDAYFQIDSDIIFRELPDFSQMPLEGQICWASDCEGYIGYNYLKTRRKGEYIINRFADILGIDPGVIEHIPGGGAQWIINQPTAELWWHIWQDCNNFHHFLHPLDSDIQKWTAEMWAQLYNLVKFGWEVKLHPELDFIRPTDPAEDWYKVKILHNAGVVGELANTLFYKGKYLSRVPFGDNFDWVVQDKASHWYVQAIRKVIQ